MNLFKLLFILCASFFLAGTTNAEADEARPYKISVLIFKHLPADKNTAPRLIDRWTEKTFANSTLITTFSTELNGYDTLLPKQQSTLEGSYRALLKNKDYSVLCNASWVTPLQYGKTQTFHLHNITNEHETLDALIDITLKYTLKVQFQAQLLVPTTDDFYTIFALDESYQTPSNQIQYIDGPIYGALIKITRN